MAPSHTKRSSRITIACNSCRSRKQKCSGGKPVCTQCLAHNRSCDWPEQLKRGPAKGYIEVLENRLHETETVLLKVLSQISDTQLASTLRRDQSGSGSYSPFSRLGKRGAEYWNRFPLDTTRNIREWQHDCLSQKSTDGELDRVQSEPPTNTQPAEIRGPNQGPHAYDRHAHPEEASPPLHLQPNASTGQLRKRKRGTERELRPLYLLNSPNQLVSEPDSSHSISQETSSWTGAPPIEFQEQFLW